MADADAMLDELQRGASRLAAERQRGGAPSGQTIDHVVELLSKSENCIRQLQWQITHDAAGRVRLLPPVLVEPLGPRKGSQLGSCAGSLRLSLAGRESGSMS